MDDYKEVDVWVHNSILDKALEENQRLRGLLARCDDWLRETLQKTGGNPRHARLIDDIEKELGDEKP